MAIVQLFKPINLTAHSNLGAPKYGDSVDWIKATYPGQVQFGLHDRSGGDSGFYDLLTITKSGASVLKISSFVLDANGDWAEIAADSGDLRPFYSRILVGPDRVTGSAGNDVVDGFSGADHMNGAAGHDVLFGGAGNDRLDGGLGNDTIAGGSGNDLLIAGRGADKIIGGTGVDTLQLVTQADVRVDLATTGIQRFGTGSVTVSEVENVRAGAGNDRLSGNRGANVLEGGAGNDVLAGGAGNDRLSGDAGNDRLIGGAGADSFVFRPGSGQDRIADFSNGTDRIVFAAGPDSLSDLQIIDRGADAVIRFGGDSIVITNLDHRLLGAEDFVFG